MQSIVDTAVALYEGGRRRFVMNHSLYHDGDVIAEVNGRIANNFKLGCPEMDHIERLHLRSSVTYGTLDQYIKKWVSKLDSPVDYSSVNAYLTVPIGPKVSVPQPVVDVPCSKSGCMVCLENEAIMAIVPCGHTVFCNGCITKYRQNADKCPICRGTIQGVLRIYLN